LQQWWLQCGDKDNDNKGGGERWEQQREANNVDANVDIDISVLQLLHQEVTVTTVGAMLLRWRWDDATRAGGGKRDKSGRSEEGVAAIMAAAGRQCGQRNESGRDEERAAAMTAAAMLSCRMWVADNAMSQTAGRQTMQRERPVMTTTIDLFGRGILWQKLAADDERQMTGGGRWQKMRHGQGGEEAAS
jgi:hypothetical protein